MSWKVGAGSNVQGSALDIEAKASARETGEVAQIRIVKVETIDINISIRSVGALMP